MKMFKKMSRLTLSLFTVFLLAACSNSVDEDEMANTETKVEMPENNETNEEVVDHHDGKGLEEIILEITLDDVADLFYEHFGTEEINISSVELEREDGRYIYQVEGWDANYDYELAVNAETAEIVEEEKEEDEDAGDILEISSVISPQKAMEAALEASSSGYVEEWELEVESNRMIYDIDVEDGDDQKVDALTGEIL